MTDKKPRGRPPYTYKTKCMRIPVPCLETVNQLIEHFKATFKQKEPPTI